MGYGAGIKAGHSVGKFGMLMARNSGWTKLAEIGLTSGIDATGEDGFRFASGEQFGQRVVTAGVTWGATELLGKIKWKKPLSIDDKMTDFKNSSMTIDRNGLTKSGRALQKHGSRPGSVFPNVPGKELNLTGQNIVNQILESPSKQITNNRFGGLDIFDLFTGKGARFDSSNNFMGFLEPK